MSKKRNRTTNTKARKLETFEQFMERTLKKAKRTKFKPVAYYNESGDIIEAVWEDCSYYAEWLNEEVTVLRKMHDSSGRVDNPAKKGEIIGVQVWALNDPKGKSKRIKDVIVAPKGLTCHISVL